MPFSVREASQSHQTRTDQLPGFYYDIHQLLDVEAVQEFIGTLEYLEHKKKRFKSLDHDVARSGEFTIDDKNVRKRFEMEYSKTAPLYYRGQIPFGQNPHPHPEGPVTSIAHSGLRGEGK
jgi:hypothetical protein